VSIARHGITDGAKGLPIISRAVVRGDTVYLCGVTPDPTGDITSQTKQVLDRIDHLLHQAGTDKSRLLTAQVWLSDMRLFETHNAVWNAWVDPGQPPVRACVQAALWRAGMLVEIMVTAAT
jgi:enamine deaminase RidA (YjgF/YER057c/UK114 family)